MRLQLLLTMALLSAAALPAQGGERLPRWKVDRYTKNEPERMQRLGYVSYGPFAFGQRGAQAATSEAIEATIGYQQFRWVETAHFRIGLALEAYPVPTEAATKKKLRAEIERLHAKLPVFNPRTRVLDPWLRLHLTAQRLEDTYTEFLEMVGVADHEFPKDQSEVIIGRGRYLGYGPYLGMREKYLILVTTEVGPYAEYLERFVGKTTPFGQRWHFKETGSLFYGVATKLDDGQLRHDTALHGTLVFNTAHLLLDGFRHYSYDLPVWILEAYGHWMQRRVSPRWNDFTQSEGGLADKKSNWRWEQETRRLLAAGKGTPFSEAYTWRDFGQIKFEDHVLLWSRMDFLMSLGPKKFAEFLFGVKGRVNPKDWSADESDLVGASRQALQQAYGLSPLSLDEKWREWVFANYSAR